MNIDLRNVTTKWINLDRDIEKNQMMEELCTRIGLTNASRVPACEGVDPHEGVRAGEEHYRNCAESHFNTYKEAIESGSFPLLILEDDVETEKYHISVISPKDDTILHIEPKLNQTMVFKDLVPTLQPSSPNPMAIL